MDIIPRHSAKLMNDHTLISNDKPNLAAFGKPKKILGHIKSENEN